MADFDNVQSFEAQKARILIMGAGGAGCNTINTLTTKGVSGSQTVAVNTDAKHLAVINANKKILIGKNLTRGLGAGGYPETGKNATLENRVEIRELLQGVDLVFLTCGLGGGTGTGSLPVLARFAKEQGSIVISCVTLPFKLEKARLKKAEEGLVELRKSSDTVIIIENERLLRIAKNLPLKAAFGIADNLIATMIKSITETISEPSLVNLDYADVRSIMKAGGVAAIGSGESETQNRAEDATYKALNHPLLEVDYEGASGALIQVIGGEDLKLEEINKIGEIVQSKLTPDSSIKIGARILKEYKDKIHVITIITGVKSASVLSSVGEQSSPIEDIEDIHILKKKY